MAKAPRAAAAKAQAKTVNDYVAALVAAEVTAKAGIVATQRKQLDSIVEALKGAPETNQEAFKANWRELLKKALVEAKDSNGNAYYQENSIGPMLSYYSVAVCAITNGIMPSANHGTLMAFVKDDAVRDTLAKRGLYAPKAQRNPEPAGSRGGKDTEGRTDGVATTLNATQLLRLAFVKLGQAPNDARLDRLAKVIAQHPVEFWKKVENLPVL